MATVELTADSFGAIFTSSGITLVDFWAEWCGPCLEFGPVFESVSEAHPDITFGKVDTEKQSGLASEGGITAIPTLMAFKDGLLVFSQPGALSAEGLEEVIEAVQALDMVEVREQIAAREAAEPSEGPAAPVE